MSVALRPRAPWHSLRVLALLGLLLTAQLALPTPSSAEPAALTTGMVEQVNQIRLNAGLPPLAEDATLDMLASSRSADMASRNYFSHTTPEGITIFNQIQQIGLSYHLAGENLAYNYGGERDAVSIAMNGFVNSAPHLANLLNAQYTAIGVGTAQSGGRIYFTLVFLG